jgi:streptomycin 6-kinase
MEAVLKVGIPHDEARHEAEALRFYAGRGAVRLLRASEDGFALLLERCAPGTNLWSLSEDEGDAVAAETLRRLWREPPSDGPFVALSDLVDEWREEWPRTAPGEGYDPDLIRQASERGKELAETQPERALLHGDFHPGNVLAAQREPWLVIDCKPVAGDPAYDPAQWLANRYDAAVLTGDPVHALRRQIRRFAERLELDPARIAGWAFVKSLGWSWGPEVARVFQQAAEAW